uniref:Uncharacterized protein n=2 Tax=Anopheles merus TaxID=30066 RepID=A0A3F2Z081_ANOME
QHIPQIPPQDHQQHIPQLHPLPSTQQQHQVPPQDHQQHIPQIPPQDHQQHIPQLHPLPSTQQQHQVPPQDHQQHIPQIPPQDHQQHIPQLHPLPSTQQKQPQIPPQKHIPQHRQSSHEEEHPDSQSPIQDNMTEQEKQIGREMLLLKQIDNMMQHRKILLQQQLNEHRDPLHHQLPSSPAEQQQRIKEQEQQIGREMEVQMQLAKVIEHQKQQLAQQMENPSQTPGQIKMHEKIIGREMLFALKLDKVMELQKQHLQRDIRRLQAQHQDPPSPSQEHSIEQLEQQIQRGMLLVEDLQELIQRQKSQLQQHIEQKQHPYYENHPDSLAKLKHHISEQERQIGREMLLQNQLETLMQHQQEQLQQQIEQQHQQTQELLPPSASEQEDYFTEQAKQIGREMLMQLQLTKLMQERVQLQIEQARESQQERNDVQHLEPPMEEIPQEPQVFVPVLVVEG